MAMLHGKAGSIAWAGTGTEETTITSWSLDASGDVAETTNMSSANDWKEYVAGFRGWTATVEANFNGTSMTNMIADLAGAAATLNLYFTGTTGLNGSAFLTGLSAKVDANGVEKITYNFQGTGALAYA